MNKIVLVVVVLAVVAQIYAVPSPGFLDGFSGILEKVPSIPSGGSQEDGDDDLTKAIPSSVLNGFSGIFDKVASIPSAGSKDGDEDDLTKAIPNSDALLGAFKKFFDVGKSFGDEGEKVVSGLLENIPGAKDILENAQGALNPANLNL